MKSWLDTVPTAACRLERSAEHLLAAKHNEAPATTHTRTPHIYILTLNTSVKKAQIGTHGP